MFASPLRLSSVPVLAAAIAALAIFAPGASAAGSADQVKVTSPRSGATLQNTAVIRTKLAKRLAARTARVELWVGGTRAASDDTAPFSFRIDTRQLADGQYRFRVKAVLASGRVGNVSRTRTVSKVISVKVVNKKTTGTTTPVATPAPTAPAVPTPNSPTSPVVEEIKNPASDWNLVWADEFNGSALDRTKWNDQRDDWLKGGVAYNNLEDDYYMPANTTVSGGSLVQTIKKERTIDGHNYTTGMVNSNKRFAFTYGYVEARMKVPSCDGCWPAFWMLPAKTGWPPEIDIYEFFDSDTNPRPYFSSHWKVPNADQDYVTNVSVDGNYTNAWHTYGMLWTPDSVQVFTDGIAGPKYTGQAVPHEDMYLIIQAALGKGYNTPDGANLQTDYVHVYQQPATS